MLTVAFDLDETFLHSKDAMAQIMCEETGVLVAPALWNSYDLAKVWMESGLIGDRHISNAEVMEWFTKHNLFGMCELAPGAYDVYEFCRRRNINIEFVTARGFDPDARNRTRLMLVRAGVGKFDLTIVAHMESKHPHMKNGSPTVFVDDNVQQVLHLTPHAQHAILMAQPHNKAFRDHQVKHHAPPLPVANSMWDVLGVLTYLNARNVGRIV